MKKFKVEAINTTKEKYLMTYGTMRKDILDAEYLTYQKKSYLVVN